MAGMKQHRTALRSVLATACAAAALLLATASGASAQQNLYREDMSGGYQPLTSKSPPLPPEIPPERAGSGGIRYQNMNRLFLLHRPPQAATAEVPLPTVIVLHSTGGDPERVAQLSRFNAFADQYGFMVAYPSAIERAWNDGRGEGAPGSPLINDVGFIEKLAGHLVDTFSADPARLYLVGLAEGGMLAQRVACEKARLFAAVATVNAAMPDAVASLCQPAAPMPILMMQGTGDPFVPFKGGESTYMGKPAGKVLPAFDTAEAWKRVNGCIGDVSLKRMLDFDPNDGSRVVAHRWNGCRNHADVVLYEIEKGGPTWPGAADQLNKLRKFVLGRPNMDIDATDEIWQFFRKYDRVGSPLFDPIRPVHPVQQSARP
jgi:polyhydroxybutyrate depolymerase